MSRVERSSRELTALRWKERDTTIQDVVKELESSNWNTAQSAPSEIHVELLARGVIPDPYIGFNEHKVQCRWYGAQYRIVPTIDSQPQGSASANGSTGRNSLVMKPKATKVST
jgi:hypothetical protein